MLRQQLPRAEMATVLYEDPINPLLTLSIHTILVTMQLKPYNPLLKLKVRLDSLHGHPFIHLDIDGVPRIRSLAETTPGSLDLHTRANVIWALV